VYGRREKKTPAKVATRPYPEVVEEVLMRGNWADLSPKERIDHNIRVCKSLGLNPLTNPFGYIMLGGKLVFYAKKDATDQLRKLNGISVEIVSQEIADGLLTVTAKATDKTGRIDTDIGVVPFKNLGGEIAANMRMKAVTKAKRRVTLSISGLGFLDETEVESTPTDDDLIAEHDEPEVDPPLKLDLMQLPNNAGPDWRTFGNNLAKILRDCDSKADVFQWLEKNKAHLAEMEKAVPKMFEKLSETIEAIKAEPT
jgi:hypothetical protein